MRAPSQEPMKIGAVDVEEFSRNLARLVEEGGRALAAYLKPREEGRQDRRQSAEEVAEVVKTLGHVAEYWLADPQRAVELQARLGKAYLDLWASAAKRLAGEDGGAGRRRRLRTTSASPTPNGRRTSSSTSSSRPTCSSRALGRQAWSATPPISIRIPSRRPSSTCGRSPMRCRRRTSSSPIPNCCAKRSPATPTISFAACACSPRTSKPAAATSGSASRTPRCSPSAAIWRRRPAR